jgi:uncharacterized repeat protein (TIGR03806 family)
VRPVLVSAAAVAVAVLAPLVASCNESGNGPFVPSAAGADVGGFPDELSAYAMVSIVNGAVVPSAGVTPYDLNTPLFSDYAVKFRTVWLPPGTSIAYQGTQRFEFPVGTVFTKSFGFPADFRVAGAPVKWVETRVIVHATDGWKGTSYVWNDAQTEATILPGGEILDLSFVDASGTTQKPSYLVPSQSQCQKCHANDGAMISLGPWAMQLNRDYAYADGTENELDRWSELGLLSAAPPAAKAPVLPVFDDPSTGDVPSRARAYLQANCSYCHNGNGEARTSGLVLLYTATDPYGLGVCKPPVAAGKAAQNQHFDVVPGHPEQSILVYRMQSTEPSIAMPELGRSLEHTEAVDLVSQWIAGMTGAPCQ